MPPTIRDSGIDRLNVSDRLALAEEIWASVASEIEDAPLTVATRLELEKRLAECIARPEAITARELGKSQALVRLR